MSNSHADEELVLKKDDEDNANTIEINATESDPQSSPESSKPSADAVDGEAGDVSNDVNDAVNNDAVNNDAVNNDAVNNDGRDANPLMPGDESQPEGLIDANGEINWNCPCLQGMADGPCGVEFKDAFSCFHYSEEEPKGVDCLEQFRSMQECFIKYPEIYGSLDDDLKEEDEATEEVEGNSPANNETKSTDNNNEEVIGSLDDDLKGDNDSTEEVEKNSSANNENESADNNNEEVSVKKLESSALPNS